MGASNRFFMVTAFKWATYAVGLFFLCSLFSMMYLRQHYTRHMPQTKQVETGRIIPVHVNYGKVVFVTDLEKRNLDIVFCIFIVASVLVAFILFVKPFVNQMSLPKKDG